MGNENSEAIKQTAIFKEIDKTLNAIDAFETEQSKLRGLGGKAASNSLGSSFCMWFLYDKIFYELQRTAMPLSDFRKSVLAGTATEKLSDANEVNGKKITREEAYVKRINIINKHLGTLSKRLELAKKVFTLFERYGVSVIDLLPEDKRPKTDKEKEAFLSEQSFQLKWVDSSRKTRLNVDAMGTMSKEEKEFVKLVIKLNDVALQNEGNSKVFFEKLEKYEKKLFSLSEKVNFDNASHLNHTQGAVQSSTSRLLNQMGSSGEDIKKSSTYARSQLETGVKQLLNRCDGLLNELIIKRESLEESKRLVINKTIRDLLQFIKEVQAIRMQVDQSKKVSPEIVKDYERAESDFARKDTTYRQLNLETKEKKETASALTSSPKAYSESPEEFRAESRKLSH